MKLAPLQPSVTVAKEKYYLQPWVKVAKGFLPLQLWLIVAKRLISWLWQGSCKKYMMPAQLCRLTIRPSDRKYKLLTRILIFQALEAEIKKFDRAIYCRKSFLNYFQHLWKQLDKPYFLKNSKMSTLDMVLPHDLKNPVYGRLWIS